MIPRMILAAAVAAMLPAFAPEAQAAPRGGAGRGAGVRAGTGRAAVGRPALGRPGRPGIGRPGRPGVGRPGRPGVGRVPPGRYFRTHGVRLRSGFYGYRGLHHRHWSMRYWLPGYRTWVFCDPGTSVWYFYSPQFAMYLPVRYLATVQPAPANMLPASNAPIARGGQVPNVPEPNRATEATTTIARKKGKAENDLPPPVQ